MESEGGGVEVGGVTRPGLVVSRKAYFTYGGRRDVSVRRKRLQQCPDIRDAAPARSRSSLSKAGPRMKQKRLAMAQDDAHNAADARWSAVSYVCPHTVRFRAGGTGPVAGLLMCSNMSMPVVPSTMGRSPGPGTSVFRSAFAQTGT